MNGRLAEKLQLRQVAWKILISEGSYPAGQFPAPAVKSAFPPNPKGYREMRLRGLSIDAAEQLCA